MIFTVDSPQNKTSGSVWCNLVLVLVFQGVPNIDIDISRNNESNVQINI